MRKKQTRGGGRGLGTNKADNDASSVCSRRKPRYRRLLETSSVKLSGHSASPRRVINSLGCFNAKYLERSGTGRCRGDRGKRGLPMIPAYYRNNKQRFRGTKGAAEKGDVVDVAQGGESR